MLPPDSSFSRIWLAQRCEPEGNDFGDSVAARSNRQIVASSLPRRRPSVLPPPARSTGSNPVPGRRGVSEDKQILLSALARQVRRNWPISKEQASTRCEPNWPRAIVQQPCNPPATGPRQGIEGHETSPRALFPAEPDRPGLASWQPSPASRGRTGAAAFSPDRFEHVIAARGILKDGERRGTGNRIQGEPEE
jgi:hypothetical protein